MEGQPPLFNISRSQACAHVHVEALYSSHMHMHVRLSVPVEWLATIPVQVARWSMTNPVADINGSLRVQAFR